MITHLIITLLNPLFESNILFANGFEEDHRQGFQLNAYEFLVAQAVIS